MKFTVIFVVFLFLGCSPLPESSGNGANEDQLKQEVLDQAGKCGEDTRQVYERTIRILQEDSELNSNERKNTLKKMKNRIKC